MSKLESADLKIFVKGLNWVGDAIISTPALTRLRTIYPTAHITLQVRPWVGAVFEHNPDIDDLWVEDDSASRRAFLAVARRVRKGKFDLGIALPNSIRAASLLMMGQVKHRVGYARSGRSMMLTRKVKASDELLAAHQVHYYTQLVDVLTDETPLAPKLKLVAGNAERARVAAILHKLRVRPDRMCIAVAPGSINSVAKRWPAERFAELADRLHREAKAEVLLIGSDKEKAVIDEVAELCETDPHNLAGEVSLSQVIALIERAHAFIGNDSGAMHIAAAFNVPQVAIFGPTDWRTTAPFSPNAKIVRHPVDCAPCMLRDCPIEGHPCMTEISVDMVIRAFAELAPQIKERIKRSREAD